MNGNGLCGGSRVELSGQLSGRVSDQLSGEVAEVSGAVSDWVEQVGRFLGVVQAALEQSHPREDATAEVRALVGQLPALIRQCRAQVPTPDMIHTWVQTLAEGRGAEHEHDRSPVPVLEGPALTARLQA